MSIFYDEIKLLELQYHLLVRFLQRTKFHLSTKNGLYHE